MDLDNQKSAVLHFLKQPNASLTHRAASAHLGCDRLAARVFELRNEGHNIHMERIETHTGRRVGRYTLLPPKQGELFN